MEEASKPETKQFLHTVCLIYSMFSVCLSSTLLRLYNTSDIFRSKTPFFNCFTIAPMGEILDVFENHLNLIPCI